MPRDKLPDTEKITINLGFVDLGRVDLLVQEGFYTNRSDFIRTAIRNQLTVHGEDVSRSIEKNTMTLGLADIGRDELEAARAEGRRLHIKVVGLARIDAGVTAELARSTIASLTVLGHLSLTPELRQALADRIT